MNSNNLKTLVNNGYLETRGSKDDFLQIAKSLGNILPSRINGPEIDILTPKTKEEAHPHSLSKLYGVHDFPFHTDGAYFLIPPKYILLRYVSGVNNPTPTIIFPIKDEVNDYNIEALKFDIWLVKFRDKNFYVNIASDTLRKGEMIFRFDPGCMKPVTKSSIGLTSIVKDRIHKQKEIEWFSNKILILNNWHFLHSRPNVLPLEIGFRTLERIMVYE
jgi:hypothetical protein